MKLLLYAMAGGALGSGARHLVNVGMGRWLGPGFPWWTLCRQRHGLSADGRPDRERWPSSSRAPPTCARFLATGVLGGYTTFSAFSLDFAVLMQRHEHMQAALYLVGSVALSILALYAGMWLTRWLLT